MREEDEILGVSDGISTQGTATPNAKDPTIHPKEDNQHDVFESGRDDSNNIDSVVDEKELDTKEDLAGHTEPAIEEDEENVLGTDVKSQPDKPDDSAASSDVELEREINQLFLGSNGEKTRAHESEQGKPKIGAAKAKRQKRAEKQAALEAEGKAPPRSRGNRKVYDPSAAMQKARGETVTSGRKTVKKK
jgi:hypothetical protein